MHESKGNARIVGTVRDSATGRPIVRADVCSEIDTHDNIGARLCVNPDSLGNYELAGLPADTNQFYVSCPGLRGELSRRSLYEESVVLANAATRRIDIRADATGCDMRPFTLRSGVFEGFYSLGFETGLFLSCDRTVQASPRLTIAAQTQWSRIKVNSSTPTPAYYVKWEGTLRGPGQYGHGGMTPYGIDVRRILMARPARKSDCSSQQ